MKTCSLCASPLDADARACPTCGIAAPGARRPSRLARFGRAGAVTLAGLAVLGALALPVLSRLRSSPGCEPHSWADWHLAMARACVTPAYVCENMTAAKMLEDPALAAELRHALRGGGGAFAHLDALVAHVREAYGCASADSSRPAPPLDAPDRRLPPGHPPVPATPASPIFQAPPSVTI